MSETSVSIPLDPCVESAGSVDPSWLLDGLRAGSEAAYEALLSRYQQPVYNLVYRLMEDPSESSDVVQEVFLKVFRNVASFRGNSSLKTWIYRIAVNEAYNYRRWFSRHRRREIGLEGEEEGRATLRDTLCDPARSPFDEVLGIEARALVEDALGDVNRTFRTAVILRDLEDLSYDEIADVLDVSVGTVKSRILRGRNALREALATRLEPKPGPAWRTQPVEE